MSPGCRHSRGYAHLFGIIYFKRPTELACLELLFFLRRVFELEARDKFSLIESLRRYRSDTLRAAAGVVRFFEITLGLRYISIRRENRCLIRKFVAGKNNMPRVRSHSPSFLFIRCLCFS